MNVVVVGNGMAGARLAAHLRGRAGVTVLGAEPHRPYNRILLSSLVAGKVGERDVELAGTSDPDVTTRLGVEVVAIDRRNRTVVTGAGEVVGYDRLVLAVGAQSALPPIKGLVHDDGSLPGRVAAFRTLGDGRRIIRLAARARRALVLGGGLLGLEVARGLAARGLAVTVLHAAGHLMERQLDPTASRVLVARLRGFGVSVELDAVTVAVAAGDDQVEAVLADGRRLAAELLVVACGVRANTELAESAGLVVERGIVVDDRLRTSDPHIFAIGDCAQHAGVVSGLVAPAWEQARVAAELVCGDRPLARYTPRPPVTRLKAAGVDLATMGDSTADDGELVTFCDPVRNTYAKLVIRDGRLAGALMLGDNPSVGAVIQLFDRGAPLPRDRRSLLLGQPGPGSTGPAGSFGATGEASPALMPDAALICQCNTVSKGALVRSWEAGAKSTVDLVAATRAGTGCGGCRGAIDGIAVWLRKEGSA